jgi:hypothetical protein
MTRDMRQATSLKTFNNKNRPTEDLNNGIVYFAI